MYNNYFPVTYYFYPLLDLGFDVCAESQNFLQALDTPTPGNVETLLYVHIPYCQDLCRFCPFHVRVDKDFSVYERYTNALCTDLKQTAESTRGASSTIQAVYFGGGSPSVLSAEQLRRIFETIYASFTLAPDVEISFEGEPKSLGDPARLELLREMRVSRLSFGLQTYNQNLREAFNISATLDDVENVTRRARDIGFDEINVDMMYNLPGQTLADLDRDIEHLLADGYDSIDYYNLHYFAFPPKFKREMATGKIPAKPSEPVMLALFEQLRAGLSAAGYVNVADQVYSRKPAVCEYFRLLWAGGYGEHRAETLAVGSSARGYIDGVAYMKYGNVNRYMDGIEKGENTVEKISRRLSRPENRGAVMFPKFLSIKKQHDAALQTIPKSLLAQWTEHGYVYETATEYRISERGKLWTNNMTTDLFEAVQREIGDRAVIALSEKAGTRTGTF
ncbi:coproporphyrinogen-III oxidase family protein [Allohahella sp. A8]|uniref:coproporphyrinogen-III oxidase family protein n=1 Tax=Allohahella sp. A8 TaxID=3141461 RepID=UPI003A80615A